MGYIQKLHLKGVGVGGLTPSSPWWVPNRVRVAKCCKFSLISLYKYCEWSVCTHRSLHLSRMLRKLQKQRSIWKPRREEPVMSMPSISQSQTQGRWAYRYGCQNLPIWSRSHVQQTILAMHLIFLITSAAFKNWNWNTKNGKSWYYHHGIWYGALFKSRQMCLKQEMSDPRRVGQVLKFATLNNINYDSTHPQQTHMTHRILRWVLATRRQLVLISVVGFESAKDAGTCLFIRHYGQQIRTPKSLNRSTWDWDEWLSAYRTLSPWRIEFPIHGKCAYMIDWAQR